VRARASAAQDYPTAVRQQAALRPSLATVRGVGAGFLPIGS
jgi:hypothetical protein